MILFRACSPARPAAIRCASGASLRDRRRSVFNRNAFVRIRREARRPAENSGFASDIAESSIAEAREARYDEAITADVSPERLRHFFIKDGASYRVKKELRELVLFAPHNILHDSRFRGGLVTCRNLLIYLNRQTQEKVLEVFHFACAQNGYLFLGASKWRKQFPRCSRK